MPPQKGMFHMISTILSLLARITLIILTEKDVASQLTKDIKALGIIKFDNQTPYIKVATHWQKVSKSDLLTIVRNLIVPEDRFKVKSSHIAEIAKRLSEDLSLKISIEGAYTNQKYLINFLNGVFNILTWKFTTDRDKYIFDYVINANYNSECTKLNCPVFTNFIKTSAGIENENCIFKSIGFGLSSLSDVKCAVFVIGESDGGKSCLLRLIESAVAPGLVSNISFQQFGDPHYTIQLQGKKLNISFDNSAKALDSEQIFKSIVSSEKIEGRALRENPIQFVPTAKLFFASNKAFVFKHPDYALYRRMVIIPFEYSIPPEKQDKHLFDKLMNERDAIFSLAAKSLKDFIESGYDFQMSSKGKAYLQSRITALHSVKEFLDDCAMLEPNGTIPISVLFEAYKRWCIENVLDADDKSEFKEAVLSYSPRIDFKKVGPRNSRKWGYRGLRLKTAEELNVPDDITEVKGL